MRRAHLGILATVVWLVLGCSAPSRAPGPARSRQPVVVAIIVDQLAAWMADERLPLLPGSGGFARLRDDGTWHKRMRYAHAITDTGPGHTALYTGTPPRENGIWANETIDDAGVKRSLFRDERTTIVAPEGPGGPSSSPQAVRRPLLADRLRAARPDSVIISLSLKDRAAVLGGGRRPTVALWLDRELDTFVTSSIYAGAFPGWAIPIAGHAALVERRKTPWRPLDPAWLERVARGIPDDGPEEGDLGGFGTTFPHDFALAKDPAKAFRSTPFADEVVLALAVAGIDKLARPDAPLFVALSLSGNDYVTHLFGPESRESFDQLLRLDAALGRFFADLDRRFGLDGWTAVLAADHGATRRFKHRLIHAQLAARLDEVAAKELGEGPWVAGVADPYVFLTPKAKALPRDRLQRLMDILRADLKKVPGIADAVDARDVPDACPPEEEEDTIPALVCRAMPPTTEARIFVLLGPEGGWDPDLVIGKGGNHGSTRDDDRNVPFFVRAPGRVAAGRVVQTPVSYKLFSETLARLLGI